MYNSGNKRGFDMKFKEKHLLPLMMAATVLTSCDDIKTTFSKDKHNDLGLLDETPQKDADKYGTEVTLYQVDVPVYKKNGERLKNQYVLTRGLKQSSYTSVDRIENLQVKKVYLNGSNEANYVKVDARNAIYTKNGFCGLFVDYNNKAVVVADKNVAQFSGDEDVREIRKANNSEQRRNNKHIYNDTIENEREIPDSIVENNTIDSVLTDTMTTDSVKTKSTYTGKQFLDTLRTMRQKEL